MEWRYFSVTQEGLHSIYTEVSLRENGCEPHGVETYQMHPFAFGVCWTQIGCILYPVFTISQEQIGINHLVTQASGNSYPRTLLATQHDLIFSCNIPCYSVLNFKQKKLNFFVCLLTIASPCLVFCPKSSNFPTDPFQALSSQNVFLKGASFLLLSKPSPRWLFLTSRGGSQTRYNLLSKNDYSWGRNITALCLYGRGLGLELHNMGSRASFPRWFSCPWASPLIINLLWKQCPQWQVGIIIISVAT